MVLYPRLTYFLRQNGIIGKGVVIKFFFVLLCFVLFRFVFGGGCLLQNVNKLQQCVLLRENVYIQSYDLALNGCKHIVHIHRSNEIETQEATLK